MTLLAVALCWAALLIWLIAGLFLEEKMMNDHASRINALQQRTVSRAAIEELERRSAPLLWAVGLIAISAALGLSLYQAGFTAALRECPPVLQGERLLSSEQRADGAVCRYAESAAGYGRKIKSRKVKS